MEEEEEEEEEEDYIESTRGMNGVR